MTLPEPLVAVVGVCCLGGTSYIAQAVLGSDLCKRKKIIKDNKLSRVNHFFFFFTG